MPSHVRIACTAGTLSQCVVATAGSGYELSSTVFRDESQSARRGPCSGCTSSQRRSLVWALVLSAMLMADSAFAQHYAVGDAIEPFTLEDQHGESRSVDASVKVILFSRDMEGGDLLKQGLADVEPGYLDARKAVYVADISGMPGLIARIFAIPAMRDRPYPMLLDRDGETTARLPDVDAQATLVFLDRLTVERIAHVTEAPAVRRELEGATDIDRDREPPRPSARPGTRSLGRSWLRGGTHETE